MALIEGSKINLGGNDYIVPPLSFKHLRTLEEKIAALSGIKTKPTADQLSAVIEIVHAAITRNYPDITKEQLEDWLDIGNMKTVIPAIMGMSGLVSSGESVAGPGQAALDQSGCCPRPKTRAR